MNDFFKNSKSLIISLIIMPRNEFSLKKKIELLDKIKAFPKHTSQREMANELKISKTASLKIENEEDLEKTQKLKRLLTLGFRSWLKRVRLLMVRC
jgi:DNA-binding XRE family transcriptional regulator